MLYNFTKKDALWAQGSRGSFKGEGEVELRKTTQKKTARGKVMGSRQLEWGVPWGSSYVTPWELSVSQAPPMALTLS